MSNKIFFDFEFIEEGSAFTMEPISIGMVREDGESLYCEFSDVDWSKANDWVLENVRPFIGKDPARRVGTKKQIAKEIHEFVEEKPEFWAYFADYDWVLLCQLFGRMVDLPEGWPMWCRDLKQLMWHLGLKKEDIPLENKDAHNALADAQWNADTHKWISNYIEENWNVDNQLCIF